MSVIKLCFKICNECAYDAYSNAFFFGKRMQEIFLQPIALIRRQLK